MRGEDVRLLLRRDGLASADLEGLVPARAFGAVSPARAVLARAPLRRAPEAGAEQLDELVFGESVTRLVEVGGWAFGQAARDGYVGFAAVEALGPQGPLPTHRVAALQSIVLETPSLRAPARLRLFLNALVRVEGEEGRFARLADGGFVPAQHLAPMGLFAEDPVAEAERFIGAPYSWGGRTVEGIDCSGLVQQAFYACGRACPRDSDQQEALFAPLQAPMRSGGETGLLRGDLVFWKGHVAVMTDPETIVHANAHHMAVAREPLFEAVDRIEAAGGGAPTAFRRP